MEELRTWLGVAWQYFYLTIVIGYYVLILIAVIKLLLENKNPLKTHAYLLAMVLIPVVGLLIYLIFGQDYRRHKMFSRKAAIDQARIDRYVEEQLQLASLDELIVSHRIKEKKQIIKLLLSNNRSFLTRNNHLSLLINGENKLAELLPALEVARDHIHIEYYIFDHDETGRQVAEILARKAQEGVEVRFIYDDVGTSHIHKSYKKLFDEAGVKYHPFMPVYLPRLSRANYRDHRKIVVIDGHTAFTGGINIADRYINKPGRPVWRDTHLKIVGEAVYSLQIVFMLNWYFVSGEKLAFSQQYFPDLPPVGRQYIQVAASGPDSDWASIMQAFFMAIVTAKEQVLITTPYFIPNEPILTALSTAALSGVDVQIIFPFKGDNAIVHAASMSYMKEVLEAGVKVYLYTGGFIHAKTIVVDGLVSSVGTANMDYRSFDQNFEVNAFIYDEQIAGQLIEQFEADKQHCVPLHLNRWQQRPVRRRLAESAARLLAPLL
ncbi:MAG TPA: cardiolipin synthase [Flammeovirgaceae bacterium]|nr:cardiolipin synthase [Flammeovirgaceae bacterium]